MSKIHSSAKWTRIPVKGFATLYHRDYQEFRLRWRCPDTGRDRRLVLPVSTLEDALETTRHYNIYIAAGKDIPGMRQLKGGMSIREAILHWLNQQTHQKAKTLADYRVALNLFGKFMAETYPGITKWEGILPDHLKKYMDSVTSSHSTRKRRLVVIKMISRHMHLNDPERYRDFATQAAIKMKKPVERNETELPSQRQILHLLEWFRRESPSIWAMLILECFAGLRGLEAWDLRMADVDYQNNVIHIRPSDIYQLKNANSKRSIPVLPLVMDCLRYYESIMPVRSATADGHFFLNSKGQPWAESSICCARQRPMAEYRAYLERKRLKKASGFKLREFRSVFASTCAMAEIPDTMIQRYLGHSGGSVLHDHYVKLSVEQLRQKVVQRLEKHLASTSTGTFWKQNGILVAL